MKYEHKEMEYLETVSSRQTDIQRFIAEGCREALLEEKRRFCFLVDKHCSFTQHMHFYHAQVSGMHVHKMKLLESNHIRDLKISSSIWTRLPQIV